MVWDPANNVVKTIGNEIQKMILKDAVKRIEEQKRMEEQMRIEERRKHAIAVSESDQPARKVLSTPSTQPRANSVSSATSAAPHAWGFGKAAVTVAVVGGAAALLLNWFSSQPRKTAASKPHSRSE